MSRKAMRHARRKKSHLLHHPHMKLSPPPLARIVAVEVKPPGKVR